jgi:hypothetical protein
MFLSNVERNYFLIFKIWCKFHSLKHIRKNFVRSIYFNFNISSTSLKLFWTNLLWNLCILINSSFMDFVIFVCVGVFACIHQYSIWTIAMEVVDNINVFKCIFMIWIIVWNLSFILVIYILIVFFPYMYIVYHNIILFFEIKFRCKQCGLRCAIIYWNYQSPTIPNLHENLRCHT